jgi:hypothetical protein
VTTAADVARALAERIEALVRELLSNGAREGHEWLVGNVHGDRGSSLAVRLSGSKAGVWCDFATGESGDALDLVKSALDVDIREALAWSLRWLGIRHGAFELPSRSTPDGAAPKPKQWASDPDRWRRPWEAARPIVGTRAETYLDARGLRFEDAAGRVLRFGAWRARKSATGELEYHPALLCALSDARSNKQCGIINIYLKPDGSDRLRDKKGKTVTGRAGGAVVMLSDFDEPTTGLVLCEGVETGIALFQREVRPIWACGAAGTLAKLPPLGGIEALTIAADTGNTGMLAADELAERWRTARREVFIITPPSGDWADLQ